MVTFILILLVALVAYFGYRTITDNKAAFQSAADQITGGVTAFGKLAEAESKLLALKVAAEAKAAEAKAVHATLDEIHKLLG
jgi:hypothetical protein